MFPRTASSTSKPYYITVTRKGTVRYRYKKLVVKENGKTQYVVRNVNNLQVYNRIEGLLKFTGSSKPRNRDFPGYGNVLQQIATRSTNLLCHTIVLLKYRISTCWKWSCAVHTDHC